MSYSALVVCSLGAGGVSENMPGSGGASLHAEGFLGRGPRPADRHITLMAHMRRYLRVPVDAVTSASAKRLARAV